MSIAKLPEAAQKQVTQKMAALLTAEIESIAILIYEIAYKQGAKDLKDRIVKHCTERTAWLESQRVSRPAEDWGVKKAEVDHLTLEIKGFSEDAQG